MPSDNRYTCPVCGFGGLSEPPYDEHGNASFDICPCCGTEYGYHDATASHDELRRLWLAAGAPWRSQAVPPPPGWDPRSQLAAARFVA
jgi:hypothetical protein